MLTNVRRTIKAIREIWGRQPEQPANTGSIPWGCWQHGILAGGADFADGAIDQRLRYFDDGKSLRMLEGE